MFSQRELAPAEDQGVVFSAIQASANSTIDQTTLFTRQVLDVYRSFPEADSIFQITAPNGGFGGMVTKPWSERTKTTEQTPGGADGPVVEDSRYSCDPADAATSAGRRRFSRSTSSLRLQTSRNDFRNWQTSSFRKHYASGMFLYADSDLKFDQPQAEVVFDRDRIRSQGVDLSQAGQDLSTLIGGNYVNRFSIQGRSYKVIPQVKRMERLTPDQLAQMYITGGDGKLVPLSTFASSEDNGRTTRAEEVSATQRRADSGRHSASGSTGPGVELSRKRDQAETAAGFHH